MNEVGYAEEGGGVRRWGWRVEGGGVVGRGPITPWGHHPTVSRGLVVRCSQLEQGTIGGTSCVGSRRGQREGPVYTLRDLMNPYRT